MYGFLKVCGASRPIMKRQPSLSILLGKPAGTESELKSAMTQRIESGRLLGQQGRVSEVVVQHESRQANA